MVDGSTIFQTLSVVVAEEAEAAGEAVVAEEAAEVEAEVEAPAHSSAHRAEQLLLRRLVRFPSNRWGGQCKCRLREHLSAVEKHRFASARRHILSGR